MSKKSNFVVGLALMLAVILLGGLESAEALAQCGGNHSGAMNHQYMGSSGHMGSGQLGMSGQAPVQSDLSAAANGYAAPVPPVSGYVMPQQSTSDSGQTMGQGGMGSGHSGHMGH